jgi:hypothetical protein
VRTLTYCPTNKKFAVVLKIEFRLVYTTKRYTCIYVGCIYLHKIDSAESVYFDYTCMPDVKCGQRLRAMVGRLDQHITYVYTDKFLKPSPRVNCTCRTSRVQQLNAHIHTPQTVDTLTYRFTVHTIHSVQSTIYTLYNFTRRRSYIMTGEVRDIFVRL